MGPQSIQLDKEKSEDEGKENTKRNNRRKLVFIEEMQASPDTRGRINLTRLTELWRKSQDEKKILKASKESKSVTQRKAQANTQPFTKAQSPEGNHGSVHVS